MREHRVKVLIAEDEPHLGALLETFLSGRGCLVTLVTDGRAALERLRAEPFDVALLDIVMPEMDGLAVLKQVRDEPAPAEVIIITGNGTVDTAISAIKLGAYDYLAKPYRMAEIEALVRRAWEKKELLRENQLLLSRLTRTDGLAEFRTRYAPLAAVLLSVEKLAQGDAPVLVTGEPGTGKSLVAHALHRLSGREGSLADVHCGALRPGHHDAELFGRDKGEGGERRPGLVEMAGGGTLYLADVDRLDARAQQRLLRLLDDGVFTRAGGAQPVHGNVRVVAATSASLADAVEAKVMRQELAFRLSGTTIALPPLRERRVDVRPLAEAFVKEFGGPAGPRLTEAARDALERYDWPGNVHEMRAVLERAVLIAAGGSIQAHDLALGGASAVAPAGPELISMESLERRHIERVLEHLHWHQGKAAEVLGISAKTLYRKIREYGLQRPRAGVLTP
ncbi:MAG: sigma-54-dependent Fis family transcriptional regulator [Gemmatimonadetes bacterium]|nr:sigma-54-dependent Fis family transcriptional regulator [Gemmatimonadota bacterium]